MPSVTCREDSLLYLTTQKYARWIYYSGDLYSYHTGEPSLEHDTPSSPKVDLSLHQVVLHLSVLSVFLSKSHTLI